jgi:hypothetical protein
MKQKCIQAVSQALGREITKAEADGIEARISAALRSAHRADPQGFAAKPTSQRLREAATDAAGGLLAEAKLKQQRQALQIQAHQRIESFIADRVAEGSSPLQALDRLIAFDADMKSKTVSIESYADAVNADLTSRMLDALDTARARWFGLADNPQGARDLIMEIRGQDSGNAQAKAGAKVWKETTEAARLRFNRAGADVGKLDDWGMPQHHSQRLVAKAGRDQWVNDTAPLLDRNSYYNPDGSRMTDPQFQDFLRGAYDTIATGGANKLTPGQYRGSGARANRGSTSRQIHFKDADSYLKYQEKYGDRSLPEVILGHIEGISKDIALVEQFGPNPDATFRYFRDKARQDSVTADPTQLGKIDEQAVKLESLYNVVTGKTLPVANERIANGFDTLRNWLSASRLGSAVITSLSDEATLRLVARTNNLPQLQLIRNQLATLNIANRVEERLANRAGLGLRAMIGTLNRFGTDSLVKSTSRKLANFVIRAQGLTAITEARRRAFSVTMMDAIGAVARDHQRLAALDPVDHATLLSKGVTEADFSVWKAAKAEDWGHGNTTMLTPESIYRIDDATLDRVVGTTDQKGRMRAREQAATKLLGIILEESNMAVIEPGARERALMQANTQRGTWKGEMARSFFQFKAFPLATISRHWRRGLSGNAGNRAVYLASLIASTTVLGAVSMQVNEILSGRDPRNLNPAEKGGTRGWIAAMLKGGSLGLYGDFLFGESSRYGQTPIAAALGPAVGLAESVLQLTQQNMVQLLEGKDTQFGAEVTRFVRSNTPGANIWYAKAALDHLIFHQLQEYFSPGYLANMRARSRREFGQDFYWQPGELTPDRAPDLGAMTGN